MEAVSVAVRIRPEANNSTCNILWNESCVKLASTEKEISISSPLRSPGSLKTLQFKSNFKVDKVFGPDAGQDEVFDLVRPLVAAAVDGYVATVFAYGTSGSGKTHTISGTHDDPGLLPRAATLLIEKLKKDAALGTDRAFMVFVTFVELYQNSFFNLLSKFDAESGHLVQSSSADEKIEIREHPIRGVYLSGSKNLRVSVTTVEEIMDLIRNGLLLRVTRATNVNDRSSRSHAILTFEIESSVRHDSTSPTPSHSRPHSPMSSMTSSSVRIGKLQVIDLAGSERLGQSGAEGITLAETQNINLSLSQLGDVLSALSKYHRSVAKGEIQMTERLPFIPYRNSKLTHLLKDSLGGNCKTLMICCIRSSPEFLQQTMTSLKYAARARDIKNAPRRVVHSYNTERIGAESPVSLHNTVLEVKKLRQQLGDRYLELEELRKSRCTSASDKARMREQIEAMQAQHQIERLKMEGFLKSVIHSHEGTLEKQHGEYISLEHTIKSYGQTIQEQNMTIEQLHDERRTAQKTAIATKHELGALQEKLHRAEQINKSLTEDRQRLREEQDRLAAETEERLSKKSDELLSAEYYREGLCSVESSYKNLCKKLTKARKQLEIMSQENSKFKANQDVLMNEGDTLREALQREKNTVLELQANIENLTKSVVYKEDQARSTVSSLTEQLENMKLENSELLENISEKDSIIFQNTNQYSIELTKASEAMDIANEKYAELQKNFEFVQNELKNAIRKLGESTFKYSENRTIQEELHELEILKYKNDIAKLEASRAEIDEKRLRNISNLENELIQSNNSLSFYQQSARELEERIESLENQYRLDAERFAREMQMIEAGSLNSVNILKQNLEMKQREVEMAKRSMKVLQDTLDVKMKDHEGATSSYKVAMQSFEETQVELAMCKAKLEKKTAEFQDAVRKISKENEDLRNEMDTGRSELLKMTREFAECKANLHILKQTHEKAVKRFQEEINNNQYEIDNKSLLEDKATLEILHLKEELKKMFDDNYFKNESMLKELEKVKLQLYDKTKILEIFENSKRDQEETIGRSQQTILFLKEQMEQFHIESREKTRKLEGIIKATSQKHDEVQLEAETNKKEYEESLLLLDAELRETRQENQYNLSNLEVLKQQIENMLSPNEMENDSYVGIQDMLKSPSKLLDKINSQFKVQLKAEKTKVCTLQLEVESKNGIIDELKDKISELEEMIITIKNQSLMLEETIEIERVSLAAVNLQLQNANGKIASLEDAVKNMEEKSRMTELSIIAKSEADRSTLKNELSVLNLEMEELNTIISNEAAYRQTYINEVASNAEILKELTIDKDNLKIDLDLAVIELKALRPDVEKLNAEIKRLEGVSDSYQAKCFIQEAALVMLEQEKTALMKEVSMKDMLLIQEGQLRSDLMRKYVRMDKKT